MPTLLCVWEQGGQRGHLAHLRLPIERALAAGYRVIVAARELQQLPQLLGDLPLHWLPAPHKPDVQPADQSAFLSYTHILQRQCFADESELIAQLVAWDTLLQLVNPDVVLFEHSPTALIAAWGRPFRKILIGNGFSLPPLASAGQPFAPFPTTPRTPQVQAALLADDERLVALIHRARARLRWAPVPSLSALFAQADAVWMNSWPELDHFGARPGLHYFGGPPSSGRVAPDWPPAGGPRVFGYLAPFPALERLLEALRGAGVAALLHVPGLAPALRERYGSDGLRFADQPLDLRQVAREAAWAVSHGNHGTAGHFMAAGLPQLLIPRHQEQLFLSMRLQQQGVAQLAYQDQTDFSDAVRAMQAPERIARARALGQTVRSRPTPDLAQAADRAFASWAGGSGTAQATARTDIHSGTL